MLLPYLLRAAEFARGTFVELGALDGNLFSNTNMLERCFNWTGLLIEANPENAAKLVKSTRRASKVHSAVCEGVSQVNITRHGREVAGQPELMSETHKKLWSSSAGSVAVPCRPLPSLMAGAGLLNATFLSLDVEGAEELVLQTVNPLDFGVIMVEMDGANAAKDERVHSLLTGAGLSYSRKLAVKGSRVYLRPRRLMTVRALRRKWEEQHKSLPH